MKKKNKISNIKSGSRKRNAQEYDKGKETKQAEKKDNIKTKEYKY